MTRLHFAGSTFKLAILVIAAYGPYIISGSIRTDHVVLYGLFAMTLLYFAVGAPSALGMPPVRRIYLRLIAIVVWVSIATVLNRHHLSPSHLLASIDNSLQPIAAITVASAVIPHKREGDLVRLALQMAGLIVSILILNSAISVVIVGAQVAGYQEAVIKLLSPFWGKTDGSALTVAEKALALFRVSGVLNQPIEAGLHHSYGLLLIVLIARLEGRGVNGGDYWRMLLVSIGGLLSLSKVFLFVGIPIALAFLMWERQLGRLLWTRISIGAALTVAAAAAVLPRWAGFERLEMLTSFLDSANPLRLVTAGRFGAEDSIVASVAREVTESSPVVGLGFGAFSTYDSAYVEYYALGGIVAVAIYISVLTGIGRTAMVNRNTSVGRFLCALLVLVIVAGLGAPAITMNRFAITLWVPVTILLGLTAGRGADRKVALEASGTTK